MAVAMTTPAYNQVVVNVPKLEFKRFKAIMKALDYVVVEKTELEEAIEDVEAGRVYSCSSVQELMDLAN